MAYVTTPQTYTSVMGRLLQEIAEERDFPPNIYGDYNLFLDWKIIGKDVETAIVARGALGPMTQEPSIDYSAAWRLLGCEWSCEKVPYEFTWDKATAMTKYARMSRYLAEEVGPYSTTETQYLLIRRQYRITTGQMVEQYILQLFWNRKCWQTGLTYLPGPDGHHMTVTCSFLPKGKRTVGIELLDSPQSEGKERESTKNGMEEKS